MANYRLNLNRQSNGDHEVHEQGCTYYPTQNYDSLGSHDSCKSAVDKAKKDYPGKQINGCYYCSRSCHTT